jgi:beta-galactosidase
VKPGTNRLALQVTSMSLADQMASASKYACHPLGGISRSVTLFSVPQVHLSRLCVRTDFDETFRDAVLRIELEIDARSAKGPGETNAQCVLHDPDSREVTLENPTAKISWSKPGKIRKTLEFLVKNARWWTPETPELYQLEISLGGHTVRQPVGFREIAVRGGQLLVNGQPVKLRGTNRHEAYPLRGAQSAKRAVAQGRRPLPRCQCEPDPHLPLPA